MGDQPHALFVHQLHTAFDDRFIQLHIGNPIHQKPADPVVLLIYRHMVAPLIEHVGTGQTGGPRANNRHLFIRADLRDTGLHIAVRKSLFNDGAFVLFDGHRPVVYAAQTRHLAERRAYPARKFREIVGL